jgi:hypothetical protein
LERREHRGERLGEPALGIEELGTGDAGEHLDHAWCTWCRSRALLEVESEIIETSTGHRPTDLELYERLQQEGEGVAGHAAFDASRVLQQGYRCDELVVAFNR